MRAATVYQQAAAATSRRCNAQRTIDGLRCAAARR